MKRGFALLLFTIVLAVGIVNLSLTGASDSIACSTEDSGVVCKARSDEFTVRITFENIGRAEGNWSVAVVFEGEFWVWKGTPQSLALNAGSAKTLKWTGNVPSNATINSLARLVVYYADSFKALDWWIRVVPSAELSISSSSVE